MVALVYRRSGLVLARGPMSDPLVAALQADLRKLGYLRSGIDGQFGEGTERAVRALQWDLCNAVGPASDGAPPVALTTFNRGRVTDLTGVVDEPLAACIEEMLDDARVPALPRSDDPAEANRQALASVQGLVGLTVPRPFLLAILMQESQGQHFLTPTAHNADDYIVVGLDHNDKANPARVTSRGYGIGQYTLFHHPPRAEEITTVMLDPVRNVERAVRVLHDKFEGFVNGAPPDHSADDRLAEFGAGPLRRCRFPADDPRFMTDCVHCAGESLKDIEAGSPLYPGATATLQPTKDHPEKSYHGVPDRATFGCDWPYAARRYNGGGLNSFHYQYQVLQRFTRPPLTA
jgi:hypothetical protein